MALIKCPECEKDVSDAAYDCPGCGCPLKRRKQPAFHEPAPQERSGCLGFVRSALIFVAFLLGLLVITAVVGSILNGGGSGDSSPAVLSSSGDMSAEKAAALMLNMNGHLCAEAVSITPLRQPKVYEVRCIEYRGGRGTVDYVLDMNTGVGWRR